MAFMYHDISRLLESDPMMDRGSPDAAASTGDAASQQMDVLVIGGAPAGSTVATLLARRGHHVTLVEKDRRPRATMRELLLVPRNLLRMKEAQLSLLHPRRSALAARHHSINTRPV